MGMKLDLSRQKTPMVMTASLSLISRSYTLRCDSKQAERRFAEFEAFISSVEHFYLGDFLPTTFVKGAQPRYIESLDPDGIPVINTLAIQNLSINTEACRYITQEAYDALEDEKKPKKNDVLLTMDGGTSIGKSVLFELEDQYAIDSHVAILRPIGLDPKVLVYLLASPLGQLQFQCAESGASGQTAVTEEDVRRFRFPAIHKDEMKKLVMYLDTQLVRLKKLAITLKEREEQAWTRFDEAIVERTRHLEIRETKLDTDFKDAEIIALQPLVNRL